MKIFNANSQLTVMGMGHKVVGTVFGLPEDSAKVLTYDAETEELDSSKEEHDTDEGGVASHWISIDSGLDEGVDEIEEGGYACHEAKEGGQTERGCGETHDAINGKASQLPETPVTLTITAVFLVEEYLLLLKTYPAVEALGVTLTLPHLTEGIHTTTVKETEVTHILQHLIVAGTCQDVVEGHGELLSDPALLASGPTTGIDILKPLFPPGEHLLDDVWGVLEVGIYDHSTVALGMVETCKHGTLLAKVA